MKEIDLEHNRVCHKKRISWTAVLVGTLVAVGLGFLLNLFSIAIGLSLVRVDQAGLSTLAIGGFAGLAVGTVACLGVAGFITGKLARHFGHEFELHSCSGAIYGFATWSLALVVSVLLASQVTSYVVSYTKFVTNPSVVFLDANKNQVIDTAVVSNAPNPGNKAVDVQGGQVNVDAQKAVTSAGLGSLLVFILFFLGALACTLGAHWGINCVCNKREYKAL